MVQSGMGMKSNIEMKLLSSLVRQQAQVVWCVLGPWGQHDLYSNICIPCHTSSRNYYLCQYTYCKLITSSGLALNTLFMFLFMGKGQTGQSNPFIQSQISTLASNNSKSLIYKKIVLNYFFAISEIFLNWQKYERWTKFSIQFLPS